MQDMLRRRNKIRMFQMTGIGPAEYAYALTSDYTAYVRSLITEKLAAPFRNLLGT